MTHWRWWATSGAGGPTGRAHGGPTALLPDPAGTHRPAMTDADRTLRVAVTAQPDPDPSRALWLVKWLLPAIPHYLVLALLLGTNTVTTDGHGTAGGSAVQSGLISLLVLIAAVGLLFTGRHSRGIYDAVPGLDRWVLRVVADVALMTDTYPPFRVDQGGAEATAATCACTPAAGFAGTLDE